MNKGETFYNARRFRRALRFFVVGRAAQGVATLALTLVTVRVLPSSDYGTYMLVWGLIELAHPLTSLGLLPAGQQFLPRLIQNSTRAGTLRFMRWLEVARYGVLVVFAAVVVWQWPGISRWLGLSPASGDVGALVGALLFAVLGGRFAAEVLEGLLEQRAAQLARALNPIARLAGVVLVLVAGVVSITALLLVDLVVSLATLVLAQWLLQRRLLSLQPSGTWELRLGEVSRFVGHMSISQLLNATSSPGALRLVVAKMFGLDEVALFSFLQQLLFIAHRFLPAVLLQNLVRPMLITRLGAGDRIAVGAGFGLLWKLNVVAVLAAIVVTVVGGDALLRTLSSGRFDHMTVVMLLLLLGLLSTAQGTVISMALQVHGLAAHVIRVSGLAVLTAPAAILGGAIAALPGVAAGAAGAAWLRNVLGMHYLRSAGASMELDWRGVLRITLAFGATAMLGALLARWAGPMIGLGCALAGLLLVLRLVRPLSHHEGQLMAAGLGKYSRWVSAWSRSA